MSDLNDNIKRIANTPELRKLIEQLLNDNGNIKQKNPINGSRSVSYQNANGGVSQKASSPGTVESDNPGSEDPVVNNGDGSGAEDGSGGDGSPRNGDKDELDLQDLLDNGAQIGDRIGSLSGLEQCGGGAEGIVYLDGDFRPYDWGDSFDDYGANEDPREANFVAGTWYQYAGVGATSASNPYASAQAYLPTWDSLDPPNAPHSVGAIDAYDPATDSTVSVTINRSGGGSFEANVTIFTSGCTIGVDSYCPASAPTNQNPSDGIHQLAFNGAQFLTNTLENDSDVYGPWGQNNGSGGPSKISGCTSGGTSVSIEAIGNGNSQVTFGTGDTYTLNSGGVVTGVQ